MPISWRVNWLMTGIYLLFSERASMDSGRSCASTYSFKAPYAQLPAVLLPRPLMGLQAVKRSYARRSPWRIHDYDSQATDKLVI
jgi:hypothetical protein